MGWIWSPSSLKMKSSSVTNSDSIAKRSSCPELSCPTEMKVSWPSVVGTSSDNSVFVSIWPWCDVWNGRNGRAGAHYSRLRLRGNHLCRLRITRKRTWKVWKLTSLENRLITDIFFTKELTAHTDHQWVCSHLWLCGPSLSTAQRNRGRNTCLV